jgi:uncharacterized phiE125 gp8 family phage protein
VRYYFGRRWDRNSPHYGLQIVTPPAVEPVSLADAKAHVRQDIDDDDAYITTLITAARMHVENWLGVRLITQTWNLFLDEFPLGAQDIQIPYGPVQSIASVSYVDTEGNTEVFPSSSYTLDNATIKARLFPVYSLIWPITRFVRNGVTIQYVTGYGLYGSVPANICHAIKLLISHWYEHREIMVESRMADLPQSVQALLSSERVEWL